MNKRRRYKAKRRRLERKLLQQGRLWQLSNGSTITFSSRGSGELKGTGFNIELYHE